MRKINKLNIVQALIIIFLLITNYCSIFHHNKFIIFIDSFKNYIKRFYYSFIEKIVSFVKWITSQEYNFNFNNREVAIGIIGFVFILIMLINKDLRKSLLNVIKVLFNKHFNRTYVEILLYTLLMVTILYKLGIWDFIYTKDTILWVVFSSLYLSFRVADNRNNNKLFLKILKDTVGVTVVLEFLLNIYTFPLIIEILAIGITLFIALMISFLEVFPGEDKNGQVHKLMTGINTYIGINILIFLLIEVFSNLDSLLTVDTLKSFVLPIIFTVMFMPYLYYLMMRVLYDNLNVLVRLNKDSNKLINYYFKVRMYLHCRLSRKRILELKKIKNHLIINMKTKKDVDEIFG